MDRRIFLEGLTLLPVLQNNAAVPQIIPENDSRLDTCLGDGCLPNIVNGSSGSFRAPFVKHKFGWWTN